MHTPWSSLALLCSFGIANTPLSIPAQEPTTDPGAASWIESFRQPPLSARPWVYWFWMDGNSSREGITADLEAMHQTGIGGLILMEVDVGVPRGPVRFMSNPWRALFKHAVTEAERLGLQITLNAGPGWTGSGGPWVPIEQSMQHLVASETRVTGPSHFKGRLPRPTRRPAYFGEDGLPQDLVKGLDGFQADVAVLALPETTAQSRIPLIDEKALYVRHPYSSRPGTLPYLPEPAAPTVAQAPESAIDLRQVVDLTDRLRKNGELDWQAPPGNWVLLRFARTSTGANTRPAPAPGLGPESDKFDRAALDAHFEAFVGTLLRDLGPRPAPRTNGWTMLHIDSWEMGAQNWSAAFATEFQQRRGYDPLPYLPTLTGRIVGSLDVSERFLWDLRQTAQELVIENHAEHLKALGRRHGFGLSIEPYDMNPCADLALGGVADVPMGEFWAEGLGFDTAFSCIEAVSIAHTTGKPIVAAESFTADAPEAWKLHPGAMKAQADWAFCLGLNRLVIHRYAHQPWRDRQPGMTMGPYGTHYERTQTWWPMVGPWHDYLARCQFLLRQGVPVTDILYLAAEGAPHVFRAPPSALAGSPALPEQRGYAFDACAPDTLLKQVTVQDGALVVPGGARYQVLVLPELNTMTPRLLRKIHALAQAGATLVGPAPTRSPSLNEYPECDAEVRALAESLWGPAAERQPGTKRRVGQGSIHTPRPRESVAAATTTPSPLADVPWIWFPDGQPAQAAPVGRRLFRRTWTLPATNELATATLHLTADNTFAAALNGHQVGAGDTFHRVPSFEVAPLLRPGTNVLTVTATNGGDQPNPAGLIGILTLRFHDGRIVSIPTGRAWESATADSGPWQPALELGTWGAAPWGRVGEMPPPATPSLYGNYAHVVAILTSKGLPPDFETDGPIRHVHRRADQTDLYFLANRESRPVDARCQFRVRGKTASLWDPVTGRIRLCPNTSEDQGRTVVPIHFEPQGSLFVVFQPEPLTAAEPPPPSTVSDPASAVDIRGPWDLTFQPGRDAPDQVRIETLLDWSRHAERGVRHFSGIATYRTAFNLPTTTPPPGTRWHLDLGRVEVMARVTLNQRDLGILWKPPFRIDITDALQSGDNRLEIAVANLWPNRLIGDATLTPDRRVTWTTWQPYQADSPLLPSGLLGPVVLQPAAPAPAPATRGGTTASASLFDRARTHADQAAEAFERCHRYLSGWLAHADPKSGLIPRNLRESRDFWNGRDAGADNYAFLVLTAALTDRPLFEGRLLDMLRAEQRLTARVDRLADDYVFSRGTWRREPFDLQATLFDSAEYVKDGLLPLTEWLGPSPWSDRLIALLEDIWKHATIATPAGPLPTLNVEVNGDLLQAGARAFWFTSDPRFLDWTLRLGDHFLLGNQHPTRHRTELRLRDHGCEVVNGLTELYVAARHARPAKADAYRQPLRELFDRILAAGRNEHGMLYNTFNPQTGSHSPGLSDTWGYVYDGCYTLHLLDTVPAYRDAVRTALDALEPHYSRFAWEGESADGYADSIEGALNLVNREPHPAAARWIDTEIRVMWAKQQPDGVIEGWHGDGNFARTSLMYALWKTQGLHLDPWRADLRVGAVRHDDALYLTLAADRPWQGRLVFDRPRHRDYLHLPLDYPRINQFPEWFTVSADDILRLKSDTDPATELTGQALQTGLPVTLTPGEELHWQIHKVPRPQ